MNKKFDLNVLEAYARSLSSKQVNMLYENKLHKKYNKESVVNEGIPSCRTVAQEVWQQVD